jgi:hypothetical protein
MTWLEVLPLVGVSSLFVLTAALFGWAALHNYRDARKADLDRRDVHRRTLAILGLLRVALKKRA